MISVKGTKTASEQHTRMRAILEACTAAEIAVPAAVVSYFGGKTPAELLEVTVPTRTVGEGYELDVADIPSGVATLRITV